MKQVLIQGGKAVVREMPAPRCGDGEVLVRAAFSLISPGTESLNLEASAVLPPGTWARRLGKVGEAVGLVSEHGLRRGLAAVRDRLAGACAVTGYSVAGTVLQAGPRIRDLVPGQRVACAGAESAHHAEIIAVPRQLVVAVPEGLPLERAAFVTLGAIALQGVRRADLRLGEVACVIGLGLVGQLCVALLDSSGCRVLGTDLSPRRVERARTRGLEAGFVSGKDDAARVVAHATGGRGVDAVIVTASTSSSDPLRQAARLVRQRGRIVVVGAVGMELDRAALYQKDAELRMSQSYGPGRYDPSYEQEGLDYPYAHVRWTENRNMEEFLRLAASGAGGLEDLAEHTLPVDEAAEAYRLLSEGPVDDRSLGVLLRYPEGSAEAAVPEPAGRTIEVLPRRPGGLGVALVGPGAFAAGVHLPNLSAMAGLAVLRAVVGRTANAAREAARRWSAGYATTDLDAALGDPEVDLVLVCTRHDQHAEQAARALEAGKAVFLEKPAAIDLEGLERLDRAVRASGRPFAVGFNRRFAPDVLALEALLAGRRGPVTIDYRVNAGMLPAGHWALGPQGGGRLIGEACHMIDLLDHLVGHRRERHALVVPPPPPGRPDLPVGDNFTLSCRYADGSLTQLFYTSLGHAAAGKERLEVHWEGRSAVIEDFRGLRVHGAGAPQPRDGRPDKGHRELLRRFAEHARGRGPAPIAWESILDVTRFTLQLDREARGLPAE